MILILTCINSNHQTFILFLAFLPSPGVQGLDKIYNVKLIHFKKVDFAWIAFQIFQIRCIRRPKSIQSKRQKRRIRTIFGRSRACNQADREAVQGRIWQKDLFVSRSGVGKKWNNASSPLSPSIRGRLLASCGLRDLGLQCTWLHSALCAAQTDPCNTDFGYLSIFKCSIWYDLVCSIWYVWCAVLNMF